MTGFLIVPSYLPQPRGLQLAYREYDRATGEFIAIAYLPAAAVEAARVSDARELVQTEQCRVRNANFARAIAAVATASRMPSKGEYLFCFLAVETRPSVRGRFGYAAVFEFLPFVPVHTRLALASTTARPALCDRD